MKKSAQKKLTAESKSTTFDHLTYEQEVRRRAYQFWEAGGCRHGEDLKHWVEAEREVRVLHQLNENRLDGFK